jgi:hypothetical protein
MSLPKLVGPYQVGEFIGQALAMQMHPNKRLPLRPGIYIVTREKWEVGGWPQPGRVLYVGQTDNLLQRLAQLVVDLLGFFGEEQREGEEWLREVYHNPGGWKSRLYCAKQAIPVGALFVGWAETSDPVACETQLITDLRPLLNGRGWRAHCF